MSTLGRTHPPLPPRGSLSRPHPPRRVGLVRTCPPPSPRIESGRAHPPHCRSAGVGFDSSSLLLPQCRWVFFPSFRIGLGLRPSSASSSTSSCWIGLHSSSTSSRYLSLVDAACCQWVVCVVDGRHVVDRWCVVEAGCVVDGRCCRWVVSMGGVLSKRSVLVRLDLRLGWV